MTDEHYRAINRAIAYVGDSDMERYTKMAYIDLQDIREKARSSLHHVFGREKKLRERLNQCKARWEGAADELARLRKERDHNELRGLEYKAQCETLLAALREIRAVLDSGDTSYFSSNDYAAWDHASGIIRRAIAEVEGKTT